MGTERERSDIGETVPCLGRSCCSRWRRPDRSPGARVSATAHTGLGGLSALPGRRWTTPEYDVSEGRSMVRNAPREGRLGPTRWFAAAASRRPLGGAFAVPGGPRGDLG